MSHYTAPEPQRSVLLTIDVQEDFTRPGAPAEIRGTWDCLPAMRRLVEAYRERNLPIVHVVRLYLADGTNADICRREAIEGGARIVVPGSAGAELVGPLRPGAEADSLRPGAETVKAARPGTERVGVDGPHAEHVESFGPGAEPVEALSSDERVEARRPVSELEARSPGTTIHLDADRLLSGSLQPLAPNEWAMYKPRWDAFFQTPLAEHLRRLGVTTAVVAGCNFPNCPLATVYGASMRDFRVVMIADAVSGVYEKGLAELRGIGVATPASEEYLATLSLVRRPAPGRDRG